MASSCPLCDVSNVFSIIYDIAQINTEQLELHRTLVSNNNQNDDHGNNTISDPEEYARHMMLKCEERQNLKRAALAQGKAWIRAREIAMTLLAKFCDVPSSTCCCSGPLDAKCYHVAVVAATFAACKFIGVSSIAFVSLDNVAATAFQTMSSATGTASNQQQNQHAHGGDDDDDDINSEFGDHGTGHAQHDAFVKSLVEAEATMLKRCGYFSMLRF